MSRIKGSSVFYGKARHGHVAKASYKSFKSFLMLVDNNTELCLGLCLRQVQLLPSSVRLNCTTLNPTSELWIFDPNVDWVYAISFSCSIFYVLGAASS